jgi:TM2 domain-containing membrane protein YozV
MAEKEEKKEAPSRVVIALLAIFLGWTGIHRFMLGDTTGGIIRICTCGGCGLLGWVEGIIYLLKTDEEFHQTYVVEKKAYF